MILTAIVVIDVIYKTKPFKLISPVHYAITRFLGNELKIAGMKQLHTVGSKLYVTIDGGHKRNLI